MQVAHTHGAFDSQTYTGTNRDQLYKDFLDDDQVTQPGPGLMAERLMPTAQPLFQDFQMFPFFT